MIGVLERLRSRPHIPAGITALVLLLLLVFVVPPIRQPQEYHHFADHRTFIAGIPNTLNVISNLPFLAVGILGILHCVQSDQSQTGGAGERAGWLVFFIGIAAVAFGSSYYHLRPNDARLVWDRLPMTVAFTSVFAVFLIERVDERVGSLTLGPAVAIGISSVVYWRLVDDLRFYAVVQFLPLLAIPIMALALPPQYSHSHYWLWAAGWYTAAKFAEAGDHVVYNVTLGLMSGHTLKHLLAALCPLVVLLMLQRREAVPQTQSVLQKWGLLQRSKREEDSAYEQLLQT